jgi:hypothetical protein
MSELPATTFPGAVAAADSATYANATALFARFKAASGGAQWDDVRSLQEQGALIVGGLSGEFHATRDVLTGRSSSRHTMGSMQGAGGYDGHAAWRRGPGGEIAVLDAPEAMRRARSQAWLDARGYWYPQRMPATFGETQACELDGRAYHTVQAIAEGGDPVTLWFADDTSLLARIVRRHGGDITTNVLDDYRNVDGLQLAFRSITDRTDPSGHTDPRQRMEIVLDRITPNVAVTDAAFAIPAMASVARIDEASGVTRVPFDLVNHHIYVAGEVDANPVRFLVDTGGLNLLTPFAARRLGLSGEGKLAASGPGEQRIDVALAHAAQMRVGAATLERPVFYVMDLGELPQVEGVAFDGAIGYEMFRRFCVRIDYANKEIVLSVPATFVAPTDATVIEFEFDRLTPIVSATLDGVPVRLTVDTGSRASLTMSSPFVRAHDLVAKYEAAPEGVLGWGVGGAVRMRAARFGTLQLGNLAIMGIAGDLFTGTQGALTNPDIAGNLGGGVLKRFTITFDYAARRMYLVPNAAFGKADTFDRSGLWLIENDGALKVTDVAPDSAGARAGIRDNDRLIAFDEEDIATRPLSEWRQRLRERPAGTAIAVRLVRDGTTIDAKLVLADRIPSTWEERVG